MTIEKINDLLTKQFGSVEHALNSGVDAILHVKGIGIRSVIQLFESNECELSEPDWVLLEKWITGDPEKRNKSRRPGYWTGYRQRNMANKEALCRE